MGSLTFSQTSAVRDFECKRLISSATSKGHTVQPFEYHNVSTMRMRITRNWILLAVIIVACGAFAQHSQPLPAPTVLYPNPSRFSYPHTAQIATVSSLGKVEIFPGKMKVGVRLLADGGWLYVCSAPSEDYVRNLKSGDRVSIQPDNKSVHLKTRGKRLRLNIIDADRWGTL